ncbi:MAG: hypothetical protein LBG19_05410 [Prevotellaceae bacterium]|nr:hypothetical protein [Prevotellaceae bacterium]
MVTDSLRFYAEIGNFGIGQSKPIKGAILLYPLCYIVFPFFALFTVSQYNVCMADSTLVNEELGYGATSYGLHGELVSATPRRAMLPERNINGHTFLKMWLYVPVENHY